MKINTTIQRGGELFWSRIIQEFSVMEIDLSPYVKDKIIRYRGNVRSIGEEQTEVFVYVFNQAFLPWSTGKGWQQDSKNYSNLYWISII